jgi:hypothetical protein
LIHGVVGVKRDLDAGGPSSDDFVTAPRATPQIPIKSAVDPDEVETMARQVASKHASIHFGHFFD